MAVLVPASVRVERGHIVRLDRPEVAVLQVLTFHVLLLDRVDHPFRSGVSAVGLLAARVQEHGEEPAEEGADCGDRSADDAEVDFNEAEYHCHPKSVITMVWKTEAVLSVGAGPMCSKFGK